MKSAVLGTLVGFTALASLPLAQTATTPAGAPTFTKDIAPIFQRSCQDCHRPGSIAPMSLQTFDEARPWARAIRAKVSSREMPPWTIDKTVGIQSFKYDRSLSNADIAKITAWVDAGSPRGNPADMPPPRQFSDVSKWTLAGLFGPPDYVIPIPEPFTVEANAPNMWVDLVAESGLKEDRWLRAFETKPSPEGFPVVHHATTSLFDENADIVSDDAVSFSEYALGKTGDILAENAGFLFKAGTKIRFNMHYAAKEKAITDRTSLGLWFYPKGYVPKYKQNRQSVGNVQDLDIPPGENNARVDGYLILKENIRMTVFQPHLHNRGKRQCMEVIYPDNHIETLNCVNWNFGWHIAYNYTEDVQPLLPKGSVLHVTTWHDNTSANKWNPDPRNWAGFGQRSSDDMAFAHVSWYPLSDEDFKQAVEERNRSRSQGHRTTGGGQ
ncbi:MAG: hypothetical protein DMF89_25435 [Acidobacteria bacterium]|nr:MAG: hypothetical protein DMF89_25435 [Acidobacteriota bacterium]